MKRLSKKLFRDVKINKSQFITIFLMVFLGVFVFAGIHAYMDGMQKSSDTYYENYNLQDIWVYGENFSKEDLDKVKSLENVNEAERKLVINTKIKDKDIDIEANFIESNNISKFYIKDGENFEKNKNGIWLDYYLAQNINLNLGDEITLTYSGYDITEKIVGLIESPDHVYSVKDETEIFPNHKNFGYVYLSINEFPKEYMIDNLMKESNISSKDEFNYYFKDFNKSDYYIFNSIIVDINNVEKIDETKQNIEENLKSESAVTDRESSSSYESYQDEIEEGNTYSGIFTALFLIIALLSVVTTMNRFVKKQRTQIVTLKALGFKKSKIIKHYVSYGFYISFVAAILGIIAGALTLGKFFIAMEIEYFEMPECTIYIDYIVYIMAVLVILITTFVTYLSCKKILKESASEALRAEMPKVKNTKFNITSKGILKKASISTKWNFRDIFRNKGRSLMAIVGVIGCTMLLVCAFGMLNTMNSYIDWEFEKICNFNYKITLQDNYLESDLKELTDKYGDNTSKTLGIEIKNGDVKETNSLTINNALDYLKYTDHKRNYMDINSDGVYITEKLSEKLNLNIGDEIEWHIFGDNNWYKTKIVGLNRDPQSQSLNMTKEFYESLGLTYKPDCIYTKEDLSNIKELQSVKSIQDIEALKIGMQNMLETMKTMVVLLIVVAAILGSVIIYNLGILSLSEKQYQFATLKVLGFKSKQIKKVFTTQNLWLTIVGVIIGLPLGYFMTDMIFKLALSDSYDFNASIKIVSYIYAIVGTLIITYVINKILAKKINNIDMVSSLKGNE